MPWIIKDKRSGHYVAGIADNGKIEWTPEDYMAWSFGDKGLVNPYVKKLKDRGYDVEAIGETIRPRKVKPEDEIEMVECEHCEKGFKNDDEAFELNSGYMVLAGKGQYKQAEFHEHEGEDAGARIHFHEKCFWKWAVKAAK